MRSSWPPQQTRRLHFLGEQRLKECEDVGDLVARANFAAAADEPFCFLMQGDEPMTDDGVSLTSVAHPKASWWRSLYFRFFTSKLNEASIETVEVSLPPLLGEQRLIDGFWHSWAGAGWIANCYSENIFWPVQQPPGRPSPKAGEGFRIGPKESA